MFELFLSKFRYTEHIKFAKKIKGNNYYKTN